MASDFLGSLTDYIEVPSAMISVAQGFHIDISLIDEGIDALVFFYLV
jgi:hypothetical protein